MSRFIVHGNSMHPAFKSGDALFVSAIYYRVLRPRVGDIVVARDPRTGRDVLKRITAIENEKYFISGDNPNESTDSRHFGAVLRGDIFGKVIFRYRRG